MKEENKVKLVELLKVMSVQEIRETRLILERILLAFKIFDIKDKGD